MIMIFLWIGLLDCCTSVCASGNEDVAKCLHHLCGAEVTRFLQDNNLADFKARMTDSASQAQDAVAAESTYRTHLWRYVTDHEAQIQEHDRASVLPVSIEQLLHTMDTVFSEERGVLLRASELEVALERRKALCALQKLCIIGDIYTYLDFTLFQKKEEEAFCPQTFFKKSGSVDAPEPECSGEDSSVAHAFFQHIASVGAFKAYCERFSVEKNLTQIPSVRGDAESVVANNSAQMALLSDYTLRHFLLTNPSGVKLRFLINEKESLSFLESLHALNQNTLLVLLPYMTAENSQTLAGASVSQTINDRLENAATQLEKLTLWRKMFPGETEPFQGVMNGLWSQLSDYSQDTAKLGQLCLTVHYLVEKKLQSVFAENHAALLENISDFAVRQCPTDLLFCIKTLGSNDDARQNDVIAMYSPERERATLENWVRKYIPPIVAPLSGQYAFNLKEEAQRLSEYLPGAVPVPNDDDDDDDADADVPEIGLNTRSFKNFYYDLVPQICRLSKVMYEPVRQDALNAMHITAPAFDEHVSKGCLDLRCYVWDYYQFSFENSPQGRMLFISAQDLLTQHSDLHNVIRKKACRDYFIFFAQRDIEMHNALH